MKMLWLVCISACSHEPEPAPAPEPARVIATRPPTSVAPRPSLPDDEDVDDDVEGVDDRAGAVVNSVVVVTADREPDRDGDSIPDVVDKCPDSPEDINGFEDIDGCPDPNDGDHLIEVETTPESETFTL